MKGVAPGYGGAGVGGGEADWGTMLHYYRDRHSLDLERGHEAPFLLVTSSM